MSSLLASQICHYCGGKANTVDHIVPRADLPRPLSRLPYWFRAGNEVPACGPCNNDKGCLRSDCTCAMCNFAWGTAMARFLPRGYTPRGYISVVRNRAPDEIAV